jgi:hypothetical protein
MTQEPKLLSAEELALLKESNSLTVRKMLFHIAAQDALLREARNIATAFCGRGESKRVDEFLARTEYLEEK